MPVEDKAGTYSERAGAQSRNRGMTADMAVEQRQRGRSNDQCSAVAITTLQYFSLYILPQFNYQA